MRAAGLSRIQRLRRSRPHSGHLSLHCLSLHCPTLRCLALRYLALHCLPLRCPFLRCLSLRCPSLRCPLSYYLSLRHPSPYWPCRLYRPPGQLRPRRQTAPFRPMNSSRLSLLQSVRKMYFSSHFLYPGELLQTGRKPLSYPGTD